MSRRPYQQGYFAQALSMREREVLDLYAEGYTRPEIAGRLHITENTVRNHSQNLRYKLGARTMAQAVAMVLGSETP